MIGRAVTWRCALLVGGALTPLVALPPGPVVELPPMIVNETIGSAHWLYTEVHGDEYLSRCPPKLTLEFIAKRERAWQRLHALVPDEFLAHLSSITILADAAVAPKAGDMVAQDVLRPTPLQTPGRAVAVHYLPNLRIDDRDQAGFFSYLDDTELAQMELAITAYYLRSLLERRTPMLPPWLTAGLLVLRSQISPNETGVTLRPFLWMSPEESRALLRDPARPRALLPAGEMFAPDALRGAENSQPRRVLTLRAQVGLFARWALDPRNGARAAFWKFARLASEQRVTEELFAQCFGFGFSDLRDRLNDYLPLAIKDPLRLAEDPVPQFAAPELLDATPLAIARLRGTWERLEISYVRRTHPEFVESYIIQARRTLREPYERGEKNAWLLAELGLCEFDAGDLAAGQPLLDDALAAGAPRPQAAYALARLRFAQLRRDQPPDRFFSAAEIAPIVEPLRIAVQLAPPLPEVFSLLADAWLQTRGPIPPADLVALARGGKLFAMDPVVSYRIALVLVRAGRRAEAGELLETGIEYATDDPMRARFAQLRSALAPAP